MRRSRQRGSRSPTASMPAICRTNPSLDRGRLSACGVECRSARYMALGAHLRRNATPWQPRLSVGATSYDPAVLEHCDRCQDYAPSWDHPTYVDWFVGLSE